MRLLALAAVLILGIAAAASAADTPPPLPAPAPAPVTPAQPAVQYFVGENGKPVGPLTLQQLEERIKAGATKRDDLVWKSGTPAWAQADTVPELGAVFQQAAPPKMPEETRYKELLVGTWQSVQQTQGNTVTVTLTYAADGRYAGFAIMQAPNAQPLQSPLAGTWTVKAVGPDTFSLALQDQNGRAGNYTLKVVDANTLNDLGSGVQSKKVGM
jgi:hypothetical protein